MQQDFMDVDSHFPKTDFSFSDGIEWSEINTFRPEVVHGFQRNRSEGRDASPVTLGGQMFPKADTLGDRCSYSSV